jgi:microcin C transport system permease protein
MNIWAYITKRILLMLPTLIGVIAITFAVIQFVPGGPVEQALAELKGKTGAGEASGGGASQYRGRQGVDAERVKEITALYGFDKPASERFWQMVKGFITFDLGKSFYHHKDVWELVKSKLPVSITLGLWTFFLSYLISLPLGIAKAIREGTHFDMVSSMIVLVGYSIPGFVLGVFLLVMFGGGTFLQWFPLRGLTSDTWQSLSLFGKVVDYLWHITLPVTASVAGSFAVMTMLTKNTFSKRFASNTC